jgi:TolB-like protein
VTARPPQLLPPLQADAREAVQRTDHGADADARGARLAVLPFVNLDNDPAQDYFVSGMMDELVTALTRIRSLFVIASSSTIALAGEALPPQVAARRLGVRYLLEGSVRRAGTRVRIAVRLTDAEVNTQIWAERFEDALEDIFALQDRVALQVAGVIEPQVRAVEMRRAARAPLQNLGCYDLYLRAAQLRMSLSRERVVQALELLDRALAQDPYFAPALAQAAGCHSLICVNGWSGDPGAHRQQGHALVDRALRVCDDDAAVLAQLANALMDLEAQPGTNIDRALALIARATALNPGLAFAWFIGGVLNLINGNGLAAEEQLLRAMRLDPASQLHESARSHVGLALAVQGRYAEAVAELRTASHLPPRAQLALACACSELGDLPQARESLRRYEQLAATPAETMLAHSVRQEPLRVVLAAALARIRASS